MKRIKWKRVPILLLTWITLTVTPWRSARADLFGGDVAVLTQILAQAIQQLIQLRNILRSGRDSLDLMREINRGINDSLSLARIIRPDLDPGVFKNWQTVDQALAELQKLYGKVGVSPVSDIERTTDVHVAEAVKLNNALYEDTAKLDQVAERIMSYSHSVSPGGAQKLTAQGVGVLIQTMNEGLRAQATGLKLQAQALAVQNHKEKESTRHFLESSNTLAQNMKKADPAFERPRF
jgi:hypothetical protein